MNEKFKKNAKVEKLTKKVGRGVRLIVIGPLHALHILYIHWFASFLLEVIKPKPLGLALLQGRTIAAFCLQTGSHLFVKLGQKSVLHLHVFHCIYFLQWPKGD